MPSPTLVASPTSLAVPLDVHEQATERVLAQDSLSTGTTRSRGSSLQIGRAHV